MLVIATGGPGASGIADGTWMVDALDPRITRAFDVVTFDARGVGLSDGRDCPRAAREYSMSLTDARTARNLVERCISEADVEGVDLHRYATVQTAEDIDAIRARLGVERITLYGVSYGTVVAQAYAAAHPDHLDGLVLDAPIDRQLPAARVWSIAAHGFLQAVDATLGSCSSDPACSADLADPERAYERLSDELRAARCTRR